MKHTPGPWKVGSPSGYIYSSETGRHIATMNINGMDSTPEWWRVDAHLIAAAPELLRNLKNMVREWEEIIGTEEENKTPADTLEHAKAAIAAAEGRS